MSRVQRSSSKPFRHALVRSGDINGRAAFTHRSAVSHSSAAPASKGHSALAHHEKLAFVGDAILGVAVTFLIHSLYPNMSAGASTELRAKMVNRDILSAISRHYLLPSNLIASRATLPLLRESTKETAELYESFLGALFYSNLGGVEAYLDSSSNPSSGPGKAHAHGRALDTLLEFLVPLFSPLVEKYLYSAQGNSAHQPDLLEESMGATAMLNQLCQQSKNATPQYLAERIWPEGTVYRNGEHGMIWKVTCVVRHRGGGECQRDGIAQDKKKASNIAANLVLKALRGSQ